MAPAASCHLVPDIWKEAACQLAEVDQIAIVDPSEMEYLYSGDALGGYTLVSALGDIEVTTSESKT